MTIDGKMESRGIICGTDFSVHASEAADVAVALAARLREKLTLVNVEDYGALGGSHPEVFAAARAKLRSRLAEESARLRTEGANVEPQILAGSVHEELIKTATTANARLIVLASIGHVAMGPILAGSVAVRVAETSPLPTLVVRGEKSLVAWARGKQPLKVLVGCDFSASSDAALAWVRDLQDLGECNVTVVHIDWPPEELERLGLQGPVSLVTNPPEVQRILERDLKTRVAAVLGTRVTSIVVPGWGRPEGTLIQLAWKEKADLIVVGSHQRHGWNRLWLGSVSRGVLHHAPTSVAVVPASSKPSICTTSVPDIKRVLVATDFSPVGNAAVPYAYAILPRGGNLNLIHVMPQSEAHPPQDHPEQFIEKTQSSPRADFLKQLRTLIPTEALNRGILTETEVIENQDVAQTISQGAERFGADVICLGSHGRSGLSKAMYGSVTRKVAAKTTRPLLIVQPPPP